MPDDEQKKDDRSATRAPRRRPRPSPKARVLRRQVTAVRARRTASAPRPSRAASRRWATRARLDRIARRGGEKLRERRKGKKGKKGLEAAASKRLAKIGEIKVKRPSAPGRRRRPEADPLLERTARLTQVDQGAPPDVRAARRRRAAGRRRLPRLDVLADQARGRGVGDAGAGASPTSTGTSPTRTTTTTTSAPPALSRRSRPSAERRDAALAKYREVESKFAGTGAAILARLAEAGLLLDKGDAKGAEAAYEDVKASPLAQADAQVRGRATRGHRLRRRAPGAERRREQGQAPGRRAGGVQAARGHRHQGLQGARASTTRRACCRPRATTPRPSSS